MRARLMDYQLMDMKNVSSAEKTIAETKELRMS